jgi:hypothetical protein
MCATHATAPAVEICDRCGAFVCTECLKLTEGKSLCRKCAARTWFGQGAGFLAFASGVTGFLGIACAPLGAVAVALAGIELGLIQAGRSPKAGRTLALCGLGLGLVGVLIGVAIVIRWAQHPGSFLDNALQSDP